MTYDELFEWLDDEGLDYDYDIACENWHGRTDLQNIISREDYNSHYGLSDTEPAPAYEPLLEPEPPEPFFYEAVDYVPLNEIEILINWLFGE